MNQNNNPQLSLLKWMFDDIRNITLGGVSHLTKEQLFTPPIEGEFPIGAYLMHLGECDLGWLKTISGEEQPEDLKKRVFYNSWFDVPKEDFNPPKEPIETEEYINAVTETRKRFLDYLETMNDANLEDTIVIKRGEHERTVTKKWIIYHVLEHEPHTRGQMFFLIRKAGWNKK